MERLPRLPLSGALEKAMDLSISNVPKFEGNICVAVDYSGSMTQRVGGGYQSSSPVSCNDVASLFAACILRQNPDTTVYRFDTKAELVKLNPSDSVMTNTKKIGSYGGGTDCSCVLKKITKERKKFDAVFILSDLESWADTYWGSSTGVQSSWNAYVKTNPGAKLVCVDLAANHSTQAKDRKGQILNVGGFSDDVFKVVGAFLESSGSNNYWADLIEKSITL